MGRPRRASGLLPGARFDSLDALLAFMLRVLTEVEARAAFARDTLRQGGNRTSENTLVKSHGRIVA